MHFISDHKKDIIIINACTRVSIHFSENLKMKNENFSSFSFFLKIENDFSNPSFKIHFSFFRKNENEHFSISFLKKKNENLTNSFFNFPEN